MSKVRFTTYAPEETLSKLKDLSEATRIPMAQFVEEAIEDLIKKYNKKETSLLRKK